MKLEICHADTCLPVYWPGHHRAHVQIPVIPGMSGKDIRESIRSELAQGAVMGSDWISRMLSDCVAPAEQAEAEKVYRAAIAAANRLRPARKGQRKFFTDIDASDEDAETVYAFFVIVEVL